MNLYWFFGFIAWSAAMFSSGAFVEHKFNIASEVQVANRQVKNLGQGQANIIQFNQQWEKANEDIDPCKLSTDQLKLLH